MDGYMIKIDLTRKQFKFFKGLFLILTILFIIHFLFIARGIISNVLAIWGFIISIVFWIIFHRYEKYDGTFKEPNKKPGGK